MNRFAECPTSLKRAGCLLVLVGSVATGCASQSRNVFDPPNPALVWPGFPLPPRVQYVGQLHASTDLKPQRSTLDRLGSLLVGEESPATLYGPRAVLSLPELGIVWIADPGGRCLHLFDLKARKYRKVNKMGTNMLVSPVGLARGPRGSFFICDAEAGIIYRATQREGLLLAEISSSELIDRPVAAHWDPETDELYVVDTASHDVKVFGPDGHIRRVIGSRGSSPGQFNFPLAIAASGNTIWVVDTGNNRIQQLTKTGEVVSIFGEPGDAPGDFALPKSIALDTDGHLYVVDGRFENVQIFDQQGRLLLYFGEEGRGAGQFWLPTGIHIDENNRIWVCDSYNQRVQVFDYLGDADGGESSNGP